MANTYYNSQLTAEEIEEVLEAINGILTQANNGKVLAISNGKLEARSVQWGGGEPTIESLSVTENGTYTAPSGVDGYSPITVNVPGSSAVVQPLSVTQNGIYNPPSGVDGYAPVTVNVPVSGYTLVDASEISASADSSYTGMGPENAYGIGSQNYWAAGSAGTHTWIAELDTAKKISLIKFSPYYLLSGATYWYTDSFVFSGSNDGTTWETLETVRSIPQSSNQFTVIITNISQAYKYYKFECWPGAWVCIGKVQFFT